MTSIHGRVLVAADPDDDNAKPGTMTYICFSR